MYISSFIFYSVFLSQLHTQSYIYAIRANAIFWLFSKKYIILTMMMLVRSQSSVSLPSFMFVGAAVSEIRKWNQNKEKKNSFEWLFSIYNLLTISTHMLEV